ncbi:MAG: hypothetical protein HQK54_15885 [Oligoflexales bacterium]|nr:hypothetical protein [Oligoflexales bacterium]
MIDILKRKFNSVDFEKAKSDVMPFVTHDRQKDLNDWCADLFSEMAGELDVERV